MGLMVKIRKQFKNDVDVKELIHGSGIALVLKILGIVFSYLFTLLVTRKLGAKAWGIFALSMVVLQLASVIGKFGMDTVLLRFVPEYIVKKDIKTLKKIYKKILLLIFSISSVIAIVVFWLSPVISKKVFHKSYLTNSFQLIALVIVPFVLLVVNREAIRGLKKIKEYMLFHQFGIFLCALFFFFALINFYDTNLIPLISYNLSILVLSSVAFVRWRKYLAKLEFSDLKDNTSAQNNGTKRFDSSIFFTILSVSIPMLLSSSLAMIMGWADTLMLGMFKSVKEVGIYNVALRVSTVTSISLFAVNTISAPKYAEFWGKRNIKGLARIVKQSTKMIFWMSFPILMFFLFFSKYIMAFFGTEFKNGSLALIILTIGQFANAISGNVGNIMNMTNNQTMFFLFTVLAVIVDVFLNYFFIPHYGVTGAAMATAFTIFLWNLLCVLYIKFKLNFATYYFPFWGD